MRHATNMAQASCAAKCVQAFVKKMLRLVIVITKMARLTLARKLVYSFGLGLPSSSSERSGLSEGKTPSEDLVSSISKTFTGLW